MTLLWTDGDRHIPCDYRLYDKANDGLTKNDHFQQVLDKAHERGFQPAASPLTVGTPVCPISRKSVLFTGFG
jgi:hypothetical protein